MILLSKPAYTSYRAHILNLLQTGVGKDNRYSTESSIVCNFYEGTIPLDISTSFTRGQYPYYSSNDYRYTGYSLSNISNTKLATVDNFVSRFSFADQTLNTNVGSELRAVFSPFKLNYIAPGTIGFYEIIFLGKNFHWYDPGFNNNYSYSAAQMDPSHVDYIGDTNARNANDYYFEYHPFSAIYGSVGLLNSENEAILNKLEVSSGDMPYLYEFGINPDITV